MHVGHLASCCTTLTTNVKIWIIAFHVRNSRKWHAMRRSESVLEFAIPFNVRFVPSMKRPPGDVPKLILFAFFFSKKM